MKVLIPPIKSQGIKTKIVSEIKNFIPSSFKGTWIEPFMGTGVVGFNLALNKGIFSDTNPHLINFYNAIKNKKINSIVVRDYLEFEGNNLKIKGDEHYYYVRERFNKQHNPLDFLFINRSCFNGMIRFNSKGGFNVPFCKKKQRFSSSYITKVVNQVLNIEKIIINKDFIFLNQSYVKTLEINKHEDIIYCDPPYIDRHSDYYNVWTAEDEKTLFSLLKDVESIFIMSTWYGNLFRNNIYIEKFWKNFNIFTQEHFYHLGGKEKNRNPMTEALVTNLSRQSNRLYEKKITKEPYLSIETLSQRHEQPTHY
jgi:DNA adenine methylase